MKKTILFFLTAFVVCGAGVSGVKAQFGASSPQGDARVKRALDGTNIKYVVDKDGDFKVSFDMGGGRTQNAFIISTTEKLNNLEIREVRSYAMVGESALPSTVANYLLEDNYKTKLVMWAVQKAGTKHAIVCIVRVAADSDSDTLETAVRSAARKADEMEKTLTDKDDL